MKKQIVIFVVGIAVFAAGYVVQSWTLAQCQKPNPSTQGCANPTDEISTCSGLEEDQCEGKSLYSEPAQKPIGTITSKTGTTSTKRIDCIQKYSCKWKPPYNGSPGKCFGTPDWDTIPFDKAEIFIVGPNPCPEG